MNTRYGVKYQYVNIPAKRKHRTLATALKERQRLCRLQRVGENERIDIVKWNGRYWRVINKSEEIQGGGVK